MKSILRLVSLISLAAVVFINAAAQSTTGSISGTVTDERQAVVPGATVTIKNVATGFTRSVTADSDGRYRFTLIPIGSYEVSVEAANFAKLVQTGITIAVNQDAVIDASLKAGGVTEIVTVTENASVLNTTTAELVRGLMPNVSPNCPSHPTEMFSTCSSRRPV